MIQGFHVVHITLHDNTNIMLCNTTGYHELTLPSARRCQRCHRLLYPPELQRLWWPDSECQAEETETHWCHFLIFHCDNHNVCTESLRGNLWGRYEARIGTPTKCQHVCVSHKITINKNTKPQHMKMTANEESWVCSFLYSNSCIWTNKRKLEHKIYYTLNVSQEHFCFSMQFTIKVYFYDKWIYPCTCFIILRPS